MQKARVAAKKRAKSSPLYSSDSISRRATSLLDSQTPCKQQADRGHLQVTAGRQQALAIQQLC